MITKRLHHQVLYSRRQNAGCKYKKKQPIHIIIINNDFSYNSNIRKKVRRQHLFSKLCCFYFLFSLLRKRLSLFAYHNKYIKNVKECRWKCFKQSANRLLIFTTIVTFSLTYFTALYIL